MKKVCLITLVLLVTTGLFAGIVPPEDAEKVARAHYFQSVNCFRETKWENLDLTLEFNPSVNSEYKFYVFNVNKVEGFVIVSSENKIQPILAYSFEGPFNHDNMAPAQKEYYNYFDRSIEFAIKNDFEVPEKVQNQWKELMEFDPYTKTISKNDIVTSPILLGEINWNQDWPYNGMCPTTSSGGDNGHMYVGCVATAMLQVMKYYNWPQSGTGTKTHRGYTVNFAEQNYNWAGIPDAGSKYNEDLARINFHAGVSVNMSWGADASGSYTENIVGALKNYFKYSNTIAISNKVGDTNWKNRLRTEIDAKRPVVYAGTSTSYMGHAWNCDGYQGDDFFHMNWGWGGYGNNYCTVNELISSATSGGAEDNFNINQRLVTGIFPNSEYTTGCVGSKTITGTEGSFDDGSSIYNYESNTDCIYKINSICGDIITMNFSKFDLGEGDVVSVYAGDENSTDLLGSFTALSIPGARTFTTTNGAITIRFTSDANTNADGWKVSYNVQSCTDQNHPVFVSKSGTFEDGSDECEYIASKNCLWRIEPPGATDIEIGFDEFDLGGDFDWVRVYKDAILRANIVAEYTKASPPSGTINVGSNVAIVRFNTARASTTPNNGWKISYSSDGWTTDIPENTISEFSVIPNPGTADSKLIFNVKTNSDAQIIITDVMGRIVSSKDIKLAAGNHEYRISEISGGNFSSGVYYINLKADGNIETTKFVVID